VQSTVESFVVGSKQRFIVGRRSNNMFIMFLRLSSSHMFVLSQPLVKTSYLILSDAHASDIGSTTAQPPTTICQHSREEYLTMGPCMMYGLWHRLSFVEHSGQNVALSSAMPSVVKLYAIGCCCCCTCCILDSRR
jgi:hypothetical protein